jgi:hypothetical protein
MAFVRNLILRVRYPIPLSPRPLYCYIIVQLMRGIDIDEFLPNETLSWISNELDRRNIDLPNLRGSDVLADGSRAHIKVYLTIRDIVRAHVISGEAPLLSESLKPTGGYEAAEIRNSFLARLMQDNQQYCESYEVLPIRELQLVAEQQDFEDDNEWVQIAQDGIIRDI